MKKTILLLLVLQVSAPAFGQIEWLKTYGLPNIDESFRFIYPAAESGYFWAAGTTGAVGHDDWLVAKLDSTGRMLWADTLGSPAHNEQLFSFHREPATGDLWLSGSRTNFADTETSGLLMKLSADGTFLFEKIFQAVHQTAGYVSITGLPDGGGAALLHVGAYGSGRLLRLDATGAETYSEVLPGGGAPTNYSQLLSALPDGRFYVFQNTGSDWNGTALAELSLRNTAGTAIWKKGIEAPNSQGNTTVRNIVADPADGSVYTLARVSNFGTQIIAKTASDGSSLWSGGPGIISNDIRLKITPTGSLACISPRHIELRNAATGDQEAVRDFANGVFYWDRRLYDADFGPDGRGALVGQTVLASSSYDGYFGFFETPSLAVLTESIIGSVGPGGDDQNPQIAEAGGHLFLANNFEGPDSLSIEIMLRKIDPVDGAERWSMVISGPDRDLANALLSASDGTLLLLNDTRQVNIGLIDDEVVIRKIDPADGAVLWETHVPNPEVQYPLCAAPTTDGGAVAVFHGNVSDPNGIKIGYQHKALRVSATGDILWQTWIEPVWSPTLATGQRAIDQVIALADGDFLAVGMEDERTGLVLRINGATGAVQLVSLLEPIAANDNRRATSAVQTAAGDYLVAVPNASGVAQQDSLLLYRLAPDGTILLRKSIRLARWHTSSRLLKSEDGSLFLLLAYHNNNPFGELTIRHIDENFETLAEAPLFTESWGPFSVAMLSDGGLALVRTVFPANSYDLQVAKTGALPTVATGESAGTGPEFTVWPNPLGDDDVLRIVLDSPFTGNLRIDLLASDGRQLTQFERKKTAPRQVFELEHLPQDKVFLIRVTVGMRTAAQWVIRN